MAMKQDRRRCQGDEKRLVSLRAAAFDEGELDATGSGSNGDT
jgi:hypothetical protein